MKFKMFLILAATVLCGSVSAAAPPSHPAVVQDQQQDTAQPAGLVQIRYPTAGVQVPARLFLASGAAVHPTVLLLHGFPGTELNLDLARAMQRAGWNVLAIHYRGVWGAPGRYSFGHTVEDAQSALRWLRNPANRKTYRIDASRLVVLGHSLGGFDAVMLGEDRNIAGYVVISGTDVGSWTEDLKSPASRAKFRAAVADDLSYSNMSFAEMVAEVRAHAPVWNWSERAARMKGRPVLVVSSNDGNKPADDAVVEAIRKAGGPAPTQIKFETDHSYNDHRVTLASSIVEWLQRNFP